jgi:diguanylate cyclase (GGDEF)-like protein
MRSAAKPANEPERLQALQRYAILDTAPEGAYDDLLAIATAICGAPMGTVSLVDAERQWFKARRGVQAQETPRDVAFCAHTVLDATRVLEVPDAQIDERFHDSPLVTGGDRIRFYAGAPLVASDGHAVGALCVMDSQPHQLTEQQRDALSALSRQVVALMELRAAYAELRHHLGEREWYERELDARREALREENSTLSEQSRTDPLTGLANRRAFGEALKRDLHEGTPLAFAIVDVDLFKQINDGWGHPFGDKVLMTVAKTLVDTAGPQNLVGRIGGEEFAVLLRHCDLKTGKALAEEVRKAVAALEMEVPVTISVGVTARHEGDGPSELYSRADAALYEAKSGGRDRVTVG